MTEPNLVWEDAVLLANGETVDILLDATSPGHWMAQCHLAEHHENGMMFHVQVTGKLHHRACRDAGVRVGNVVPQAAAVGLT